MGVTLIVYCLDPVLQRKKNEADSLVLSASNPPSLANRAIASNSLPLRAGW